jgi:tight adherence protein C
MFVDGLTIAIFALGFAGLFALLRPLLAGSETPDAEESARRLPPPGPLARILATSIPQPAKEIAGIEKELRQAGYYEPFAKTRYLATRNGLLLVVIMIAIGAVAGVLDQPRAMAIALITGFVVFAIVYGLPRLYLQSLAARRVDNILRGLPDALDMLTMCVTSGLPLREALPHVAEETAATHPEVSTEFKIIQRQAEAGSMAQSLRQFAERTGAPDIRSLAAIVSQTERLGTNVALAIRDYSDNVRRTRRQRAEERASKIQVKMLFPVILCLAPPVYLILVGPAMLELSNFLTRDDFRPSYSVDDATIGNPNATP